MLLPHNMPHLRTGTDNRPILTQPVAVGRAGSGGTTHACEGLSEEREPASAGSFQRVLVRQAKAAARSRCDRCSATFR